MHISLTPELENAVKAKVQSGLYNNASEVIREALRPPAPILHFTGHARICSPIAESLPIHNKVHPGCFTS